MTSSVSRKRSPTELTARSAEAHRLRMVRSLAFRTFQTFDRPCACVIKWRISLARRKGGTMKINRQLPRTTSNQGVGSLCVGPSESGPI